MEKKKQTRQLGIKITLLKMIDNLASPQTSDWNKAKIIEEFCHLGSNLLREEIERDFGKSEKLRIGLEDMIRWESGNYREDKKVILKDSNFQTIDKEAIIEGDVFGTLEAWQKLHIKNNERPIFTDRGWGEILDKLPPEFRDSRLDYKDLERIVMEEAGRLHSDKLQQAFNYIFNGLIKKGILKIDETIEIKILPDEEFLGEGGDENVESKS